jgi:hypothetical protein
MMRRFFSYGIIILALISFFPATHRLFFRLISNISLTTPIAVETENRDMTATSPSVSGTERCVTIDPRTIYIGDDGGVGLVYEKEFTLTSVEHTHTLSLRVAGMVGARNDNESEDYKNGYFTNKLYINEQYIDNLNNYCFQEEDRTFRTILVPLPPDILRPGRNTLVVMAKGPKGGNHDDFALQEIRIIHQ